MSKQNKIERKPDRVLRVNAKCSDLCNMQVLPGLDGQPVNEMDGYVPSWFPNPNEEHYGDYISLEIDMATGQILNWKTPTVGNIAETFHGKE